MTVRHLYADGTEVARGYCITPDHFVQTFTVTIRSSGGVSADAVKDQIQKRNEVTAIEMTGNDCIVRNVKRIDH